MPKIATIAFAVGNGSIAEYGRAWRYASNPKPALLHRRALALVAQEPHAVTAADELPGDAEGWGHIAAAVPGDDQNLSHSRRSSPCLADTGQSPVRALTSVTVASLSST